MAQRNVDFDWIRSKVDEYSQVRGRMKDYADLLYGVLSLASRRLVYGAIVQARPKTLPSFTEKIFRKFDQINDPIRDFTDLCGARVIVQTRDDLDPICSFITENFDIDWENSVGISDRLGASEFGYRSIHYIVQFRRGTFPNSEVDLEIPDLVYPDEKIPMKAEIQVRTLLAHAWSEFAHRKTYKASFRIPDRWERELATVAALLENSDSILSNISSGLQRYEANYDSYMTSDEILREIQIQELILEKSPGDISVAHRIAKLAMATGNWERVVSALEPHVKAGYQPVVRDLGIALCKVHRNDVKSEKYKRGQKLLHEAIEANDRDLDAIASLAGTYKKVDPEMSLEYYRMAFEIDQSDPYVLGNYLEAEIASRGDASLVSMMTHAVRAAIERCRDQAEVGMNMPWARFDQGKFHLLLNEGYDAMKGYMDAISASNSPGMIDSSLGSVLNLKKVMGDNPGIDWATELLQLGRAVRFDDETSWEYIRNYRKDEGTGLNGAVVIVAGSTDAKYEPVVRSYRDQLIDAFKDYSGIVISGGTDAGICRLVGDVQEIYGNQLKTIGYTPVELPDGAKLDKRYREIRTADENNFSPLQPIGYWQDIIAAGIKPSAVKLLGIGGRALSEFEYRLALTFGASVAILHGTEADFRPLEKFERYAVLPNESYTLRAYIGTGTPSLSMEKRESIAIALHDVYRRKYSGHLPRTAETLSDWEHLPEDYRDSNRRAVDHYVQKLNQIGCTIEDAGDGVVTPMLFSGVEIEVMAEMEHGRWLTEKLLQGWRYGQELDYVNKKNPYMVSWDRLTEEIKEIDRGLVKNMQKFLSEFGLMIVRVKKTG